MTISRTRPPSPRSARRTRVARRHSPCRSILTIAGKLPQGQRRDRAPVSTTKSARRRFSRSGICAARIAAKRSGVIPGRRITRSRCSQAGAETTMIASHSASARGLEQQRDVEHDQRLRAAPGRRATKPLFGRAHHRMQDPLRAGAAPRAGRTPLARARRRSIPPASPRTPGNAASTAADRRRRRAPAAGAPRHRRRTAAHRAGAASPPRCSSPCRSSRSGRG